MVLSQGFSLEKIKYFRSGKEMCTMQIDYMEVLREQQGHVSAEYSTRSTYSRCLAQIKH
jgi:hypothetical protein